MTSVLITFFKMIGKIGIFALIAMLILAVIITIAMANENKKMNRFEIIDCKNISDITDPDDGYVIYRASNKYYYKYDKNKRFRQIIMF